MDSEARKAHMLKVVEDHALSERRRDLDAVMATLVPHPVFIIHGLRIEGYDNVREYYRRLFEEGTLDDNGDARGLTLMVAGENTVLVEAEMSYKKPDGTRQNVIVAATFPFSGDLASGEIVCVPAEHEELVFSSMPDFSDLAAPLPKRS